MVLAGTLQDGFICAAARVCLEIRGWLLRDMLAVGQLGLYGDFGPNNGGCENGEWVLPCGVDQAIHANDCDT